MLRLPDPDFADSGETIYMTSFEDMSDRDAHWKRVDEDPDWIRLFARLEYQHNVSGGEIIVMRAKPYSDF